MCNNCQADVFVNALEKKNMLCVRHLLPMVLRYYDTHASHDFEIWYGTGKKWKKEKKLRTKNPDNDRHFSKLSDKFNENI